MGQPLTLNCIISTVRGITSRVDTFWSINGTQIERTEGINVSSTSNHSMQFMNYYTILQLNTADNSKILQCGILINVNLTVMATEYVILSVIGKSL